MLLAKFEGLAAFAVALGVEGIDQTVFFVGIKYPKMTSGRHRNIGESLMGAINVHQLVFFAEAGDCLIENATRDADKIIFRLLGQQYFLLLIELDAGPFIEQFERGQFDGGTAAQAGAGGEIAGEVDIKAGRYFCPGGENAVQDTEWIIGPGCLAGERDNIVQRRSYHLRSMRRVEANRAIIAWCEPRGDIAIDGGTKDFTTIVISVIANKFNTTRGAGDPAGSFTKERV